MKKSTLYKMEAIQRHIHRNFKRWFKTYPNVQGIHLGLRKKGGKTVENDYCIVFHVTRKFKSPRKKIPTHFPVKMEGQGRILIPTDVIEAGPLRLHGIKIGDQIQNKQAGLIGTISFFFSTPTGVYAGSNMHVLMPDFVDQGITRYDVRKGDPPQTIQLDNNDISTTAKLITAKFKDSDIGFARLDNPASPLIFEKVFKSAGPMKGTFSLTLANSTQVSLSFCGLISGVRACTIKELGATKKTALDNVFLTNLIKLEKCSEPGDSGAAVFDSKSRLVGVILGADNDSDYALHIDDVLNFFQTSKL